EHQAEAVRRFGQPRRRFLAARAQLDAGVPAFAQAHGAQLDLQHPGGEIVIVDNQDLHCSLHVLHCAGAASPPRHSPLAASAASRAATTPAAWSCSTAGGWWPPPASSASHSAPSGCAPTERADDFSRCASSTAAVPS